MVGSQRPEKGHRPGRKRDVNATYNASGQPLTVTDPNENTTTFTYDTRGNRLTAEDRSNTRPPSLTTAATT